MSRAVAVGLTRRSLLAAAAGALAGGWALGRALPAGRARATQAVLAEPASGPRRCVVLGPAGTIYPGSPQAYTAADNAALFRQTRTRWVRLWADWPTLEPRAGRFDGDALARLDGEIAAARRDGLRVVLTLYRFPTWANGIDAMSAAELAATMPDRSAGPQDRRVKQVSLRPPDDVSATSPFARFTAALLDRYGRGNVARPSLDAAIDVLEVCNEPNLLWWPQQAPNDASPYASDPARIVVPAVVARMFATVAALAAARPGGPVLAGPGCADTPDSNRLTTGYASFAERLLAELAGLGFAAGPGFAYSHHNYTDVTFDQGPGTTGPDPARTTNFAADLRRRLVGRWAGWPAGDASDPGLLLTEGGTTLPQIASLYPDADPLAKQAELIARNWARMSAGPDAAGIAMSSQYLFYTDPNYDSGLCDAGGATRPAFGTWGALPSRA